MNSSEPGPEVVRKAIEEHFKVKGTDATEKRLSDWLEQDTATKLLVYQQFLECLRALSPQLSYGEATQQIALRSLQWFLDIYPQNSLDNDPLLFVPRSVMFNRMKRLFSSWRKMGNLPDEIRQYMAQVIELEPVHDLLLTMAIDSKVWITQHDVILTEDALKFTPAQVDERVHKSHLDAIVFAYRKPSQRDESRLTDVCMEHKSRADTYALIFAHVQRLVTIQCAPLMTGEAEETRKTRQDIVRRKVEWFLDFAASTGIHSNSLLLDTVELYAPTITMTHAIERVLNTIMFLLDYNVFTLSFDIIRRIKEVLRQTQIKATNTFGEPPFLQEHELRMSLFSNIGKASRGTGAQSDYDVTARNISTAASITHDYDGANDESKEEEDLYASLEGIWLEMDTRANRLYVPQSPQFEDYAPDEAVLSSTSGVLELYADEMVWYGYELDESAKRGGHTVPKEPELAFRVSYKEIRQFHIGRVEFAPNLILSATEPAPTVPPSPGKQPTRNDRKGNLQTNQGSRHELGKLSFAARGSLHGISAKHDHAAAGNTTAQEPSLESDENVYFLALYGPREVVKFYPIYEEEVGRLHTILKTLIGKPMISESELVKRIAQECVIEVRCRVLQELQEMPGHPWINKLKTLTTLMEDLILKSPQRTMDLERLFHSCRLEPEVTKETIEFLRKYWHSSKEEEVQIKILNIVDRLLHRAVFHDHHDSNATLIFKWLRHLEDTVNPYKSPDAFRLVVSLTKRAKALQLPQLTPLVPSRWPIIFDHWAEFVDYRRYYGVA